MTLGARSYWHSSSIVSTLSAQIFRGLATDPSLLRCCCSRHGLHRRSPRVPSGDGEAIQGHPHARQHRWPAAAMQPHLPPPQGDLTLGVISWPWDLSGRKWGSAKHQNTKGIVSRNIQKHSSSLQSRDILLVRPGVQKDLCEGPHARHGKHRRPAAAMQPHLAVGGQSGESPVSANIKSGMSITQHSNPTAEGHPPRPASLSAVGLECGLPTSQSSQEVIAHATGCVPPFIPLILPTFSRACTQGGVVRHITTL